MISAQAQLCCCEDSWYPPLNPLQSDGSALLSVRSCWYPSSESGNALKPFSYNGVASLILPSLSESRLEREFLPQHPDPCFGTIVSRLQCGAVEATEFCCHGLSPAPFRYSQEDLPETQKYTVSVYVFCNVAFPVHLYYELATSNRIQQLWLRISSMAKQ